MWFVTLVFCPRSRASQKASKQSAESTGKQATISALKHLTNNPIRPPSPRRILAVYIIDMQYPRVVGAYPAAGQFLRADLATIILYSKERVGKYPAVIYSVLMFPPSFIIPISGRCSPGTTHHYGPRQCCPGVVRENSLLTYLKDCTVFEVIHVDGFC